MNKRNQSIDLFKFIFSIFIIAIHAQIFLDTLPIAYYSITMGICRVAVPFFFIVSGYYFYFKLDNIHKVKAYIKKLVLLFCKFELLEIVIFTPVLLFTHPVSYIIQRIFTVGLGGSYWYLISLILSLIILYPLWKKDKIIPGLIVGLLLYLFSMTYDSYSVIFKDTFIQQLSMLHTSIWTWPQAGLVESLFYLSIGGILAKYKFDIKHINIYLFISFILLLIECNILQAMKPYDGNCYLSLIILTPLLVLWCLKHPVINMNTDKLSDMSLYIYLIHQIVLNIIAYTLPLPRELKFLLTSCIVIIMSYLLVRKQRNKQYHK